MKKFLLIASLSAFTFGAFAHSFTPSDTTKTDSGVKKSKKRKKHSVSLSDTTAKPEKPTKPDTTKK